MACLTVELLNSAALVRVLWWIRTAGTNIVGKISQSLGLKQGKAGSILDSIGNIANRVQNAGQNGNDETPIDIPGLGSFTPTQIKQGAAAFLGKAKTGEVTVKEPEQLGILKKLATGKNVGFADALPLLTQFLLPGPGEQNTETRNSNPQGSAWDS